MKLPNIWEALDHKGRIATVIGMLFALPYNVQFMIDFYKGIEYTQGQLEHIVIVNVLAMFWFMLPSRIVIESPKFKIIVED